MLYRIKFISEEVDGFVREIKIDSEASFLELHKAILKACNYPDDQLTSFYVCDEEWRRKEQITREDMGVGESDQDIFVMEETPLSDYVEDEGQHFEYVFDPFSDRSFFLDVVEEIPGERLSEPVVVRSKGKAPKQIKALEGDILSGVDTKKGLSLPTYEEEDDNFLFGEGAVYNDDELDLEGFEISEGRPY